MRHEAQCWPPVPQAIVWLPTAQTSPKQQPLQFWGVHGVLEGVQVPPPPLTAEHVFPAGQMAQVWPEVPQLVS